MKNTFLYLVLFLLPFSLFGQSGRFYSTDKNLSSSLIHKITQDKKGFIWISTEYGLNKFDGNQFTIYKHHADDSLSLKNNYVSHIIEDSKGFLWVGCINGLMRYDRAFDRFDEIAIYADGSKITPHVTSILETHTGQIVFSTSGYGVFTLDEHLSTAQLSDALSGISADNMYEDANFNIWIGTGDQGMNCYHPETGKVTVFRKEDGLSSNHISAITGNREGFVFIGTSANGLNVYDPHRNKIYPVHYQGADRLLINSLCLYSNNELLIGTDGQGMKVYHPDDNTIEDYTIQNAPFNLSNAKIHSILCDRQNNLWLGVFQKGVVFLPATQRGFEYIGAKSAGNNPIGNNAVWAIYKDANEETWVATDIDGIYGLDQFNREIAHYSHSIYPYSVPNIVLSVFEDSNHDLWIGSYLNGLSKLNRKTGQCFPVPELKNERIFSICEDKDKHLIIGTLGSGLYLLDISGAGREIRHFKPEKSQAINFESNALSDNWINCVLCDREGLIWIGHYHGMSCYDPKNKTFINYIQQNTFLKETIVLSLFEDYRGNIYAGTKDGLYYFNKQDTILTHYSMSDGLSDEAVCGITDDNEHNLWFSTFNGLNRLNVVSGEITNYYAGDGLQGNEFSRGAVFKDKNGKIYFGGIYGITCFDPENIKDNTLRTNLYITNFYLNNLPIRKGDCSGRNEIVSCAVIDTDVFTLSYRDNTFSFDLSTLDFTDPEQISYQYRIKKLSPNWTALPLGMNRITYTNLSPGKYTVEIRALSNGIYSNDKQIGIIITPPWYQTAGAYALYVVLLLTFIYSIVSFILSRIRYRREMTENEHAKAISEAKLQFFTNISHEIRTPMTLIITPLEKLIREHPDAPEQNIYILIYRNAQRILRLVNQIMDMRKLDKGQMPLSFHQTNIIGFIQDLMATFDYLAQKKNIRFSFEHALESLNVWIDLNNFDKVLMNILSNAFKYTPDGGEIRIQLTTGKNAEMGDYFEIGINDTGIGIDENETEKIFDRFYQVNNSYSNFGTGVGLHLSRLLVELHKGIIFAQNRTDTQGSCFIVRLPVGNEHLNENRMNFPAPDSPEIRRNLPELLDTAVLNEDAKVRKTVSKTKYRILVVDDDPDIRNYLKSELSKEYLVSVCPDGKEGLEAIHRGKPDLVISDIMMPNLDGISLTKRVKTNININHIPVILLSAKTAIQDKLDGLETEADAYFEKPFNIEILKQTINNLIAVRKTLKNKYSGQEKPEQLIQPVELKSSDEILLEKIMKVVNEHLADTELSVQILSDTIGISRGHLHQKIKSLTNQSASDFIRGIRLKQAADLLTSKKLSVSEVAYATGFSGLSHFSNAFKEFYGMSPTEYVATNSPGSF
ncbi:hybrid sensor histidine kinase/response regulator [Bacteroidia bacterium]|nr:hybrid sensor histidine kinase/response regulator [Bacteroidia bacterium]